MHLKIDVSCNQVAIAANATNIQSATEIFQRFLLDAPFLSVLICLSPWLLLLFISLLARAQAQLLGYVKWGYPLTGGRRNSLGPHGLVVCHQLRAVQHPVKGTRRKVTLFPSPTPSSPTPDQLTGTWKPKVLSGTPGETGATPGDPWAMSKLTHWLTPIHQMSV